MKLEDKIQLYSCGHVKGECRSNEYEARIKQEKRLNIKLDLADTMFNELTFTFTKDQKKDVKTLIKLLPNFKKLHSKATNEEIILSFILYTKSVYNQKNINFTDPNLWKTIIKLIPDEDKQKLFPQTYEIIFWKITSYYIQKQPILPTEPRNIDHNILYKGQ